MTFVGHWERVRYRYDGRTDGASARSFHFGDMLKIAWRGRLVRIFGITGPTGGHAVVVSTSEPDRTIDFYSPVKRTHVLLYQSPPEPLVPHDTEIINVSKHDPQSRGTYLNIDEVELR
jgi:hypothetical protein